LTSGHGGTESLASCLPRTGNNVCNIEDTRANEVLQAVLKHTALLSFGKVVPYHVMGLCHRKYCDLNRKAELAYQEPEAGVYYKKYHGQIEQYLQEINKKWPNQHCLLLDIHGQSTLSNKIIRGTQNGRTVSRLRKRHGDEAITGPNGFFGLLVTHGCAVYPENTEKHAEEHPAYNGGWTVQRYSGIAGGNDGYCCDCIQIEIGNDFRGNSDACDDVGKKISQALIKFHANYLTKEHKN